MLEICIMALILKNLNFHSIYFLHIIPDHFHLAHSDK